MKTQHDSHNSVCVCLPVCVCMCVCVCMYGCFKRYDMSAGSYLEESVENGSFRGSKRWLKTFKKPIT